MQFQVLLPLFELEGGVQGQQLTASKESQLIISYGLVSHSILLGPICELKAPLTMAPLK